jgi:hypothetical protein
MATAIDAAAIDANPGLRRSQRKANLRSWMIVGMAYSATRKPAGRFGSPITKSGSWHATLSCGLLETGVF